jgi:hypothetical protein
VPPPGTTRNHGWPEGQPQAIGQLWGGPATLIAFFIFIFLKKKYFYLFLIRWTCVSILLATRVFILLATRVADISFDGIY